MNFTKFARFKKTTEEQQARMPDSVVVRCGQCSVFQVIPQLLPVKDGAYFNCVHCSSKNGEPSRQPCVVHRMPDGVVLRSYDVDEMRKQAKKLNAVGTSDRQDARMSSQKSRILHTLEEQRLRRIQIREKLRSGDITEKMIDVLEQENTVSALTASRRH